MIGAMPRKKPPFVQEERTRHGKVAYYFRRGDGPRTRLPHLGTTEFTAAYYKALAKVPVDETPKHGRPASGSVKWLITQYQQSAKYLSLSLATRKQRDNIFKGVIATGGNDAFADVDRKAIIAGVERRHQTPAQARNFLDAMRGLFRWAKDADHVTSDPTEGIKNPKRKKTEGFKAWTEDEVAKYEARWKAGTPQRVWMHVLLYTGVRRGDAVMLGKQHVRNGVLTFVTEKGREKERIEVTRRIEPELAATLAIGPCSDLAFICGKRGKPLTKESFGNDFKSACVEAGITDKSAHGLRKLAATLWAERGATEHELMALFGWLTPAMAALYTKAARRKMLALNAHDRLAGKTESQSAGETSPENEAATTKPRTLIGPTPHLKKHHAISNG